MAKKLERDLSLAEVVAISIGAMIGSGIFILPALALDIAGPAVVLAYFLAALLVLPAALSKAEMATAMPEAGGTYIYIERGMGPLLGTVAGIGTWFSLTFKSGLALVGGVPYLVLVFDVPVKSVAIGLAVFLIGLNLFGTKQTGQLQAWLVVIMLVALTWFVFGSMPEVQVEHFRDFVGKGAMGILKATGLVFVSYAGVTKVASVAEEIEDPGRNIPLGILGSLALTTALYVLLVIAMIGVVPPEVLAGSETPMADAADSVLGYYGTIAVIGAALMALVSTANAGILSASRYPLAMARDRLLPSSLQNVSERFGTPIQAISITGLVLLVLIAFVPILEIAKLASAFQILVFILVNIALVAFREGHRDYEPEFRSPLYPWIQIFGIFGGLILLTQMGLIPFVGAIVISLGSVVWYFYWGRQLADREGVATQSIREQVTDKIIQETKDNIEGADENRALIGLREGTAPGDEQSLLRLANAAISGHKNGLDVMQFDQVVDQIPLGFAVETMSPEDKEFENQIQRFSKELGIDATHGEIAAHDIKAALVNYVRHKGISTVILPGAKKTNPRFLPDKQIEWLLRNTPADILLADIDDLDGIKRVTVLTRKGAYEPSKVTIADAIAEFLGVPLRLLHPLETTASTDKRESIESYHTELSSSCQSEVKSEIVDVDVFEDVANYVDPTDLAIVGLNPGALIYKFKTRPERDLVEKLPCSSIQFRPQVPRDLNWFERFLERRVL
jgi:amino acid transporter